jgi:hypothetical protein
MPNAGQSRRHGKTEQDQARGVVEQALAFQQHHQPARQGHAFEDCFCGYRVRRRHDGAERKTRRPRQIGHDPVRDQANRKRGERHGSDGQQQYAPKISTEIRPGGEIGPVHQQRRQEQDEDQLRIETDRGEARDKCQHNTARDQRRRRWQAQNFGEQF